jgi:predicted transcriptional regulator
MTTAQITLSDVNSRKVRELAERIGRTPDDLVNEAVQNYFRDAGDQAKFDEWREAMIRVEGMWADRDDLPDFEQVRRSLDRDVWSR